MTLTVDDLLDFAQYALAAAIALQRDTLSPEAASQFAEWTKANDWTRKALGEFQASTAATATRRAFGSLIGDRQAQAIAQAECFAALEDSDVLRNQFASADFEAVADSLAQAAIYAYRQHLDALGGQR